MILNIDKNNNHKYTFLISAATQTIINKISIIDVRKPNSTLFFIKYKNLQLFELIQYINFLPNNNAREPGAGRK